MLTEQNQSCDPERGFSQGEAYLSHSRYAPHCSSLCGTGNKQRTANTIKEREQHPRL